MSKKENPKAQTPKKKSKAPVVAVCILLVLALVVNVVCIQMFSAINAFMPADAEGKCVYCSHCQPCPAGLDVALINKYYDLARVGDALAAGHYRKLEKKASDCVGCGHCDGRCPFHVDQSGRMREIAGYFGE